jgi:hypothetical protein
MEEPGSETKPSVVVIEDLDAADLLARKPFVPRAGKAAGDASEFAANFLGAYDTKAPDDSVKLLDALDLDYGYAQILGNRRVRTLLLCLSVAYLD